MAQHLIFLGRFLYKVILNLKVLTISPLLTPGITFISHANSGGGFLEGGSETTPLAINNCIVGMLSNPRVIKKAHEELDRVIGSSQTLGFEDESNLPYLRQIIKETLRWRPINKLGANRYATRDDWYEDYFIPNGSIIMVNGHCIMNQIDGIIPRNSILIAWKVGPRASLRKELAAIHGSKSFLLSWGSKNTSWYSTMKVAAKYPHAYCWRKPIPESFLDHYGDLISNTIETKMEMRFQWIVLGDRNYA